MIGLFSVFGGGAGFEPTTLVMSIFSFNDRKR
jgi:hypothetical protein